MVLASNRNIIFQFTKSLPILISTSFSYTNEEQEKQKQLFSLVYMLENKFQTESLD